MAAKWSPQFDLVADGDNLVEERRDLTIVQEFDGDFNAVRRVRRGGDRVAPHRAIPIRCGQPQVDVLAGAIDERLRQVEEEAFDARGPLDDFDNFRALPADTGFGSRGISVIRVALLAPRIAIYVISSKLPKSSFISLGELETV